MGSLSWAAQWRDETSCHQVPHLRLGQVEVEALAQCLDGAGASLEGGAPAGGHHVNQQDDPVCMLAAGQEALYAQHLQRRAAWHLQLLCVPHNSQLNADQAALEAAAAETVRAVLICMAGRLCMTAWTGRVHGTGGRCEPLSSQALQRSVHELLLHRCMAGTCRRKLRVCLSPSGHPLWHRKMLAQSFS